MYRLNVCTISHRKLINIYEKKLNKGQYLLASLKQYAGNYTEFNISQTERAKNMEHTNL